MEVKILSADKSALKLELVGEDHTFANALRTQLWKNTDVRLAGYNIEHPLVSHPVLIIESDGKQDPKKIVLKAAEELRKKNLDFISKIDKLL